LSDLKNELPKIRDQLEISSKTFVELYSQTPFGNLKSLVDASHEYPDLCAFHRQAGQTLLKTLTSLSDKWNRSEKESFSLLLRLEFGSHNSFDEWSRQNKHELTQLVTQVDLAILVLKDYLNTHQSKLQTNVLIIRSCDVIGCLESHGLILAPMIDEQEILNKFRRLSCIGREWKRTVGGRSIERPELNKIIGLVESGVNTVLITDQPGSGKTCLLLDLADYIEERTQFGLLFIKGDRFTQQDSLVKTLADLSDDIPGLCGRLSECRQVVVIIDSLDVLSLNQEHEVLTTLLNLIDQLNVMQKVTVIAACRSFDLQYDSLLRDRRWEHKIHLANFDYEKVVVPLLDKWGISTDDIDSELKHLLQLPNNLSLFEAVAQRSDSSAIRNAYELHEIFLDEVVRKNQYLGDTAITILQQLADQLLFDRTQFIPLASFQCNETIRRALVSCGVLYQDSTDGLGFGHQTLFDSLVIHSCLARNVDLVSFIKAHPPFPFLRPAVRTFVFYLRIKSPERFSRQIRNTLSDDTIAYHFKRLIVESLAEIVPQADDWPLIRWLFQNQSDLFRRLFSHLKSDAWFYLLKDHWLPALGSSETSQEWYTLFVTHLNCWMNTHPKEVVKLWQTALTNQWGDTTHLSWRISFYLQSFEHWETEGATKLIDTLVNSESADKHGFGSTISRYVENTGQGDELLWAYITRDISEQDTQRLSFGHKLHCESNHFHNKEFLQHQLKTSEKLLTLAIKNLETWATRNPYYSDTLSSVFLDSSSWKKRHSKQDMYRTDALSVLLNAIEHALMHHAKNNTSWWKEHEPKLRSSVEITLRYFLINAYTENPENNVDGISYQLIDDVLLGFNEFRYEIGELIRAGYHFLDSELQEANQKIILKLDENRDWGEEKIPVWVFQHRYEYLIWMPVIFRLPETQAFIDKFEPQFSIARPEPYIHSRGGMVGSPISLDQVLTLSDRQLFRLLHHYNNNCENSDHPADYLTGGRSMITHVLGDAAAFNPERYLNLVPELEKNDYWSGYLACLVEGIAKHIGYRFGRLQLPQGWETAEPKPDRYELAQHLLKLLETHSDLWNNGHAVARMVESCCEILDDPDSANRIIFLLYQLLTHESPEEHRASNDLYSDAINSVRGVAAGSTITLCNRLMEQDKELPELILPLLRHNARDPAPAVRSALLRHLPYLTYKRRSWGWQLFNDIFREPQIHLWPLAEQHLYHQYHDYFSDVVPFLDRMRKEAPDEAGGSWGRIMTLATLTEHVQQDELFSQLQAMDSSTAWEGAAQVL
jgi:hypothetical protein